MAAMDFWREVMGDTDTDEGSDFEGFVPSDLREARGVESDLEIDFRSLGCVACDK